MYHEKRIALVIPAYNEERLIGPTLDGAPPLIDKVYVIDDASTDDMPRVIAERAARDPRIEHIRHERNMGVGQGIVTGYQRALEDGFDIVVVVGGDNQMPLDAVTDFLDPIIEHRADYTKGNRFARSMGAFTDMPRLRLLANMMISAITKIASGYYQVVDVVDGYTAISRGALQSVDWDSAWKGYGYPMDFLIRLNTSGQKILDVPRRAIYLPGERQSQIKGFKYFLTVSPMLLRGFVRRMVYKYLLYNFHPLIMLFALGMLLVPAGLAIGVYLVLAEFAWDVSVASSWSTLSALLLISGIQFLLFAMLFDMQEGR